jgi:hypothetical protein
LSSSMVPSDSMLGPATPSTRVNISYETSELTPRLPEAVKVVACAQNPIGSP